MEVDFGLWALYRRVEGVDVHRMQHVVTVLLEQPDGSMQRETRQFGGLRRDCRELAAWLVELRIELAVMGAPAYLLEERVRPPGTRRRHRLGRQRPPGQARAAC